MFKSYLLEKQKFTDKILEKYLNELHYPKVIAEGMRYSVLNGGKRLRPILLFMVLELFEKELSIGKSFATAIEFIHSYSLVHDDLPALDNDDFRRGKPTTHKKFGEAEAILIGDALLTYAFFIASKPIENISSGKQLKIISLISEYSGISGMIGGQMVDIESEGVSIEYEKLEYIHRNKTGKLICLPIEIGAILSDATEEEYLALKRYAEDIGVAFQIKDDILDIEGEFEKLGKVVGSDLKLEKTTYPALLGLERSKVMLKERLNSAKECLKVFENEKIKYLIELVDYLEKREN